MINADTPGDGATTLPILRLGLNPKYTEGELEHVLADAEPSLVFAFADASIPSR